MEIKWVCILFGVIFGAGAVGMAFEEYSEKQCVQAFANSTRSTSEIAQICGIRPQGSISISDKNAK